MKRKTVTYLRRQGRDCWHWMEKCQHCISLRQYKPLLAAMEFKRSTRRPTSGELCNHCLALEGKGKG